METEHDLNSLPVRRSKRWIVGGLLGFLIGSWLAKK